MVKLAAMRETLRAHPPDTGMLQDHGSWFSMGSPGAELTVIMRWCRRG